MKRHTSNSMSVIFALVLPMRIITDMTIAMIYTIGMTARIIRPILTPFWSAAQVVSGRLFSFRISTDRFLTDQIILLSDKNATVLHRHALLILAFTGPPSGGGSTFFILSPQRQDFLLKKATRF